MTNTIGATPEERELIEGLVVEAYERGWREGCDTLLEDYYTSGKPETPHKDSMNEGCGTFMGEKSALLESLISDRAKLREALEAALREIPATCSAYQDGWAALTGQSNGE